MDNKYNIIFEDEDIIVVYKSAGLALASAHVGQSDLVSLLTKYLADKGENGVPYLGIVHRLDQPVSGLVVFAKTKEAAAFLSKQVTTPDMEKIYLATVFGHIPEKEGVLTDYLSKDSKTNMAIRSSADDKNAKFSKLSYKVIDSDDKTDTVRIKLFTGRHHQIRAQFAFRGFPLVGDVKYGNDISNKFSKDEGVRFVKLSAVSLSFMHPSTKEKVSFNVDSI